MPTSVPPGVTADGNVRVWWVPAIADTTAPKLSTELNATGSLDITCYLPIDGFAPTGSDATFTDDRLCLKTVLEDIGSATWTIDNITYIYAPQGVTGDVSNKAYNALTPGLSGFFVVRWGMDVDTAPAVGQKVDVYPVKLGVQVKLAPERNAKLKVRQKPAINGPVKQDIALAA